jgi:hypothetical protein
MTAFIPRALETLKYEAANVIPLAQLSADRISAARAALDQAEAGAGGDLSLVRCLGLRTTDGAFVLGIERCLGSDYVTGVDRFGTQWEDLSTGLAVLRSPDSPAIEAERRRAEIGEAKKAAQASLEALRAQDYKRQQADEIRRRRLDDLGVMDWERLEPWEKAIYRMAAAAEEEGLTTLATRFRAIPRDFNRDRSRGPGMHESIPWKR